MTKKRLISTICLLALCVTCACAAGRQGKSPKHLDVWEQGRKMAASVELPVIPTDSVYYITDFGASRHGDSKTNAKAINAAICRASDNGGGRVFVPYGEWLTGPITMKSHVDLYVENGGTLLFDTDPNLYLPVVRTRWEGIDCYNLHPLIYANGATDISVTGEGTIDGQASKEKWWPMCGAPRYGYEDGMLKTNNGDSNTGRPLLTEMEQGKVNVENRKMGIRDALRPQLINFYECERVLIEGVTLRNSPFWVIHPCFVNNLTVRDVTIISHGPNSDGCDPEGCHNVLIENCFFDTGDDCIAIKSGRNNDARAINIATENVMVRNCQMKNGHGGVVIGSEIGSGFKNLWVEDCQMDSPELDRVIRIKTNPCRGGVIDGINVRNVKVGQCREAVLKINLDYEPREKCDRSYPPVVQNVNIDNVNSGKSKFGVLIIGLKESCNVRNVNLSNCSFNNVEKGNKITGLVENVTSTGLKINGKKVEL